MVMYGRIVAPLDACGGKSSYCCPVCGCQFYADAWVHNTCPGCGLLFSWTDASDGDSEYSQIDWPDITQ